MNKGVTVYKGKEKKVLGVQKKPEKVEKATKKEKSE